MCAGPRLARATGDTVREWGPLRVWGSGPWSPNLATDELLEELEMEEHCRGHSLLLPTLSPRVSRSFHQQAAGTTKSGGVFATALAQPRLRGDGEMSS